MAQFEKVWREAVDSSRTGMSVKSHFRYRESMKKFLWYCAEEFRLKKLANLKKKHVRGFVEYRRREGVSEKTLRSDLSAVRFFYRYVCPARELPDNRALGLERLDKPPKDRAWTDREFRAMVQRAREAGRRDVELAMRLARYAGLRIHECTRLSRADAEAALASGVLRVKGKGGRVREIPLRPEARETLTEALREFPGRANEKLLVPVAAKTHEAIKRIQKFIYLHREEVRERDKDRELTFHGLRHSFAREEFERRARKAKGRAKVRAAKLEVAELLGHGRPEVTTTYLGPGGPETTK